MSVWWGVKVTAGLALVVMLTVGYTMEGQRLAYRTPELLAQSLVVVGGGVHLWHYVLLKRAVANISNPQMLLVRGGLFGLVRHPMYLGDLLLYTGLALLAANTVAFAVCLVGMVAIVQQSRLEDRALQSRFPEPFDRWAQHTKLIVPGIF